MFNLVRRRFSSLAKDTFMHGTGALYISEMFTQWKRDPQSVHPSWSIYFSGMERGVPLSDAFQEVPKSFQAMNGTHAVDKDVHDHLKVQLLVRAYQVRGHHLAQLDPLGILQPDLDRVPAPELDPSYYGFGDRDMEREFMLGEVLPFYAVGETKRMKLSEILSALRSIYCGSLGIEYMHILSREECDWIRSKFEVPVKYEYSVERKRQILRRIMAADSFERFIHNKFPGEKRFGLDGCESLIPGMKRLIDVSAALGVDNVVMGMPHRGRLNVLSNVVKKPLESIFCEFNGDVDLSVDGSGDVKYHLGMNHERVLPTGKKVNISLVANPSHLEAVDPVVLGKVKGAQLFGKDIGNSKSLGILIHGDAAFAGQGVVYESLGFSDLPNYRTGGTIHIIVNNQIGFTTDPRFSRSTPYCTDIAKTVNAPIIHVNGDDVESVVFACEFVAEWRHRFKRDVVVDIVCYRNFGHNEFDEPLFTQPRMYKAIAKKKRIADMYAQRLVDEGSCTEREIDAVRDAELQRLSAAYNASKNYVSTSKDWITSQWHGFRSPKELSTVTCQVQDTSVSMDKLKIVGHSISTYPDGFDIHKGVAKILEQRKKMLETGKGIDMATAEALAIGTLLIEGNHVRVSGQDVERGTFSQRHAVIHDQSNESQFIQLANITKNQAPFTICNSSLSEFGVLGFEYGYSLVDPRSLVIWEAQFGDFCNNAQCIIDQFIVSGEQKWLQRSGLTMLLPHGYDGAGPEHSNGHIERFLDLCDDSPFHFPEMEPSKCRQLQDCNIQVVMPSTPSNYFHVLRRQICRDFRKLLILFTSKSLLRHPQARSDISSFSEGSKFERLIDDPHVSDPSAITRLVFCSGQVYYTLSRNRESRSLSNIALVRIEQLSPFPFDLVLSTADKYPNVNEIVWCQEEAMNVGPWSYVEPRIRTAIKRSSVHSGKRIVYTGRPPCAGIATGFKKQHIAEEESLIEDALKGNDMKSERTLDKRRLRK